MASPSFCAEYGQRNANCNKCGNSLENSALRLGRETATTKHWFHPRCMFESFVLVRDPSKKVTTPRNIKGWGDLTGKDKHQLLRYMPDDQATGEQAAPALFGSIRRRTKAEEELKVIAAHLENLSLERQQKDELHALKIEKHQMEMQILGLEREHKVELHNIAVNCKTDIKP